MKKNKRNHATRKKENKKGRYGIAGNSGRRALFPCRVYRFIMQMSPGGGISSGEREGEEEREGEGGMRTRESKHDSQARGT